MTDENPQPNPQVVEIFIIICGKKKITNLFQKVWETHLVLFQKHSISEYCFAHRTVEQDCKNKRILVCVGPTWAYGSRDMITVSYRSHDTITVSYR